MIRIADNQDIPVLLALGNLLHSESPNYGKYPYDREKTAFFFESLIAGRGAVFLYEESGVVLGAYLVGIEEDWQNYQKTAFDYVLYVAPERRYSGVAATLVQTFIRWAKELKAARVCVGTTVGINDAVVSKLYEGLGFKQSGKTFQLELN